MELHTKIGRLTGTPKEMKALLEGTTDAINNEEDTREEPEKQPREEDESQEETNVKYKYVKGGTKKRTRYDWKAVLEDLPQLVKQAQKRNHSSIQGLFDLTGIKDNGANREHFRKVIHQHPDVRRDNHTLLLPGQNKEDVKAWTYRENKHTKHKTAKPRSKPEQLADRGEEIIAYVKESTGVNLKEITQHLDVSYHGTNTKIIKDILHAAPGVYKDGWQYKHVDNTRTPVSEDIKKQKYEQNKKRMNWVHSRARHLVDQDPKMDYAEAMSRAQEDWNTKDQQDHTTKKDELQAILDEADKQVGKDFPELYPVAEDSYGPLQGLLKQVMAQKNAKLSYFDLRQTTNQMFGDWDGNAWLTFIESLMKNQEAILEYFNASGRFKHEKEGKYDVIRWIKTKNKD